MLGTSLWKYLAAIKMSHDLFKWLPTSFHIVMTLMTSQLWHLHHYFHLALAKNLGVCYNGIAKADFIYVILTAIKSTGVMFLVCLEALHVKWIFYNNYGSRRTIYILWSYKDLFHWTVIVYIFLCPKG